MGRVIEHSGDEADLPGQEIVYRWRNAWMRAISKAWTDDEYKKRLVDSESSACAFAEVDFSGQASSFDEKLNFWKMIDIVVIEAEKDHNGSPIQYDANRGSAFITAVSHLPDNHDLLNKNPAIQSIFAVYREVVNLKSEIETTKNSAGKNFKAAVNQCAESSVNFLANCIFFQENKHQSQAANHAETQKTIDIFKTIENEVMALPEHEEYTKLLNMLNGSLHSIFHNEKIFISGNSKELEVAIESHPKGKLTIIDLNYCQMMIGFLKIAISTYHLKKTTTIRASAECLYQKIIICFQENRGENLDQITLDDLKRYLNPILGDTLHYNGWANVRDYIKPKLTLTLPPAPAEKHQAMAITDYMAAGMIYPITGCC